MEPIVNPWIWYFVGLAGNFGNLCAWVTFVTGVGLVCCIVFLYVNADSTEPHISGISKKAVRKTSKILVVILIAFILFLVFAPSESTVLKMYISKKITRDTMKNTKGVTGDIREAIKRDIIEIIQEANKVKGK